MSHPLQHPAMRVLIDQVAHAFHSTDAYLTVDRHLLFLCGGSTDTSLRRQFLSYATTALPSFRAFLAESAAKDVIDFGPPTFLNLSLFEQFIADFSDCIVIFLESPGALAELGLFSNTPSIRTKLLVVNNIAYQATNSFINYGPLAEVNATSILRPVLYVDPTASPVNFDPIQERLLTIFASKNRRRFSFASYDALPPVARLAVVLVVIHLFSPISLDDIFSLIESIFGKAKIDEIKHLISLAVAIEYVHRVGHLGDLFSLDPVTRPLLEFPKRSEIDRIRVAIIDLYREHFPDLYNLLGVRVS